MCKKIHSLGLGFSIAFLAMTARAQTNIFPASGNVGIGISNPGVLLDVNGNSTNAISRVFSGNAANFTYFVLGRTSEDLEFGVAGAAGQFFTNASQGSGVLKQVNPNGNLMIGVGSGSASMTLIDDGNVGIGTVSPGAKLEINGNLKLTSGSGASVTFADGTVQSTAWTGSLGGGDYAESVDLSGDRKKYEPGDVLVIDHNSEGKFSKSARPYSTSVLGIYSTKPGLTGRRQISAKSPNEVPMAMMGIVPTKVSAENGPIRPGDLLVTSSTPGYAMKGTDHSRMLGALIGKALGHLDSGLGSIEVGVALQ